MFLIFVAFYLYFMKRVHHKVVQVKCFSLTYIYDSAYNVFINVYIKMHTYT